MDGESLDLGHLEDAAMHEDEQWVALLENELGQAGWNNDSNQGDMDLDKADQAAIDALFEGTEMTGEITPASPEASAATLTLPQVPNPQPALTLPEIANLDPALALPEIAAAPPGPAAGGDNAMPDLDVMGLGDMTGFNTQGELDEFIKSMTMEQPQLDEQPQQQQQFQQAQQSMQHQQQFQPQFQQPQYQLVQQVPQQQFQQFSVQEQGSGAQNFSFQPVGGVVSPTQAAPAGQATPIPEPAVDFLNSRPKISNSRRYKADANNDPSQIYRKPTGLRPWGPRVGVDKAHLFQYFQTYAELKHNITLSRDDIVTFILGQENPIPGRKLTLWIQHAPAQVNDRYANGANSSKCRYKGCPGAARTILKGFFRVAFDEFSDQTGAYLDPMHNAFYLHLHCFESIFDLGYLIHYGAARHNFRILPDTRQFPFETRNPAAITRDYPSMTETYDDWVEGQKARADALEAANIGTSICQWYTGFKPEPTQILPHAQRLGCALTETHLALQNPHRAATRVKRGGANISIHKGDLDLYERLRSGRRGRAAADARSDSAEDVIGVQLPAQAPSLVRPQLSARDKGKRRAAYYDDPKYVDDNDNMDEDEDDEELELPLRPRRTTRKRARAIDDNDEDDDYNPAPSRSSALKRAKHAHYDHDSDTIIVATSPTSAPAPIPSSRATRAHARRQGKAPIIPTPMVATAPPPPPPLLAPSFPIRLHPQIPVPNAQQQPQVPPLSMMMMSDGSGSATGNGLGERIGRLTAPDRREVEERVKRMEEREEVLGPRKRRRVHSA